MEPNRVNPGKVIITAASTGGFHGKKANPNLPEQPHEIIQSFHDCFNAGAVVAHIHVRDTRGVATSDVDVYGEVIEGVMARCPGMITQVGNGVGVRCEGSAVMPFTLDERMNLLNITPVPDQLTINVGTFHSEYLNHEFLWPNPRRWNSEFVQGCKERGIGNELEVYDLSHIHNALELMDRGVLEAPLHFSIVLGASGGAPATVQSLMAMVQAVPEGSSWQAVILGRPQPALTGVVLGLGGNVRVGLEDTVCYAGSELALSNVQLVERAVRIARELGREIAHVDEARTLLGLPARPQQPPS
jgi:3-keto-5-aminohexanoate cleavage enzyme